MESELHPVLGKYFFTAGKTECELLKQQITVRHVPKGETVFAAGAKADVLFFILEGRFAVHKEIGIGRKTQAVALLDAGSLIGETAVIGDQLHRATVIAVESSVIAGLSSQALEMIREQMSPLYIDLMKKILSITSLRLQKSSERLALVL